MGKRMRFNRIATEIKAADVAAKMGQQFILPQLPEGLQQANNAITMTVDSPNSIYKTLEVVYAMLGQNKDLEINVPYQDGKPNFGVVPAQIDAALDAEFAMLERFMNEKLDPATLPEKYRKAYLGQSKPQLPNTITEADLEKAEKEKKTKNGFLKNIASALGDLFKYFGGDEQRSPKQIFTSFAGNLLKAVGGFLSKIFKKVLGEDVAKEFDGFAQAASKGVVDNLGEAFDVGAKGLGFLPSGGPNNVNNAAQPQVSAAVPTPAAAPARPRP
jgi:hypothetical protein